MNPIRLEEDMRRIRQADRVCADRTKDDYFTPVEVQAVVVQLKNLSAGYHGSFDKWKLP